MTETEIRNLVVSTARKYIGCRESDGSHRKIIDIYNAHKPLARSYAVTYKDAWCATYVSAVGILCGLTDIIFTECGCGPMISLYKAAGRWKEADSYRPKAGDIIMYDWQDSGSGDNTGVPDHVGIVVSISGNTIRVIEGNISDSVGYRNIAVNGRYIRGYCLPDYASKARNASETHSEAAETQKAEAEGKDTYSLKEFICDIQSATGSEVDGIAGNETIGNTPTISAKKNRRHAVVKYVQQRLDSLGYDIGSSGADGIIGKDTTAAIKAFQDANGCVVDGEITAKAKTWRKLLGME